MPIIDPDRDPALDPDSGLTPYQRAESWLYMMWMDVYHKCIAMIEQMIIDGTLGGGGGGKRELGYIMAGELVASTSGAVVPNLTGETITFTKAQATVAVAPTGDDITCELNVDDTAVSFTIAAGDYASTLQTGLSVAWADGTTITGSVTTVGSTIAGSDLSMILAE